ncbi:M56 family metallopeptidase, partial [candidate division CSSED10-310 bacterium]
MNFLIALFSENLVFTLGWTIIHSLWQGTAVAILFTLVLLFIGQHRSQVRYIAGVMALVLIFTISAVTFTSLQKQGFTKPISPVAGPILNREHTTNIAERIPLLNQSLKVLDQYLPVIVVFWLSGCFILSLRLAGGIYYTNRLKVKQTRAVHRIWLKSLNMLSRKAHIRQSIKLLESALVKVPLTIGYFKPVILLPLGLISNVPPDQVDAILAHEIAHIYRKDYLVNLLQSLLDVLYFYHPAVRWISALVRNEREHCCDDFAVSLCGDSDKLIKALVFLGEYKMKNIEFAIAATGRGSRLLDRVRHLAGSPDRKPKTVESLIAFVVMGLLLLTLVACINTASGSHQLPVSIAKNQEMENKVESVETKSVDTKMKSKSEKSIAVTAPEIELKDDEELKKSEAEMKKQETEMMKQEAQMRKQEAEMKKHELEMRMH